MIGPEHLALLIPITSLIVIAIIVKIVAENRTRRTAIEKGMVDENLKYLFENRNEANIPSSLKWGIVLVAVGVAGFIGGFLPYNLDRGITFSLMLMCGGLGLIIYYFIAAQMAKKAKEEGAE